MITFNPPPPKPPMEIILNAFSQTPTSHQPLTTVGKFTQTNGFSVIQYKQIHPLLWCSAQLMTVQMSKTRHIKDESVKVR